jgi:hypothetical protein
MKNSLTLLSDDDVNGKKRANKDTNNNLTNRKSKID